MEDTGDDTQAQDSQPEEEPLTTEDITAEFFEETTSKLVNVRNFHQWSLCHPF